MMNAVRRGFTLIEMIVVMIIIGIAAGLAAPALARIVGFPQKGTTAVVLQLLHDARQFAILHGVTLTLDLDPKTGHFRADTSGVGGAGTVIEDSLRLGATEKLETVGFLGISPNPELRLRYIFFPSGAAIGDSMVIRGSDSTRGIFIDKWSGLAYTVPR
jgi:prepilin-type N-terminal cleavage/methylation domain-containing protein